MMHHIYKDFVLQHMHKMKVFFTALFGSYKLNENCTVVESLWVTQIVIYFVCLGLIPNPKFLKQIIFSLSLSKVDLDMTKSLFSSSKEV